MNGQICKYCPNIIKSRGAVCSTCRSRVSRLNNPVRYAYLKLKDSAKRRNIVFAITLDWFKVFCKDTGYMERKGKMFNKYTVDRIKNDKGYEPGNLQLLTLSENSYKYQTADRYVYRANEMDQLTIEQILGII